MNENTTVIEEGAGQGKALQLRDEPLVLLSSAPRHTELVKNASMVLEGFAEPCKHHQGHGMP